MENYAEYGREAEIAVLNYLNTTSGMKMYYNDSKKEIYDGQLLFKNPNKTMKAVRSSYGDITLNYFDDILRINVVRGTWVSHTAVDKFHGQFYCMFPKGDITSPSQGRVILNSTLKNYWKTCNKNKRISEMIGNKKGFRYNNLRAYITLEDFVIHISKMIIMNIEYGSKEFYMKLKYPFIKDYIKKLQEAEIKV